MAIRTVTFAALPDQVSPCTPQDAGVQGDHQATAVVFELDPSLVSADYCYRWEFVDGNGQMDTMETFTLTSEQSQASVALPRAWTMAGGIAEIRLVISQLDPEGEEQLTLYTLAGKLRFDSREGRLIHGREVVRGLTPLIVRAQQAADDAAEAAEDAREQAEAITGAEERADAAAVLANAAAQRGETAADQAEAAVSAANTAASAASTAAQQANTAAQQVNGIIGQYDRLIPYVPGTVQGTAITASLSPQPEQEEGLCVRVKVPSAFTPGYTLSVSDWSAPVAPQTALAGVSVSWPAGIYTFVYDGAAWRVQPSGVENQAYTDLLQSEVEQGYIPSAQKGAANGVAALNSAGKLAQMPAPADLGVEDYVTEAGSNANGYYWKFASGRMVCWVRQEFDDPAWETWGDTGLKRAYYTWTYPVAFTSVPIVSLGVSTNSYVWVCVGGVGRDTGQARMLTSTAANPYGFTLHGIAIGNWR
ncbi:MAG TPA: hypothetical protein H9694_01700 [Firmicutes bacterium]|nr:hypothetical protein [Bacillota bacterium]